MLAKVGSFCFNPPMRPNLLLCLCLALIGSSTLDAVQLRTIRYEAPDPATERVVLEFDGHPGEHRLFTLANPERVVLDFAKVKAANEFKSNDVSGNVLSIRTGTRAETDLRVVLDLRIGLKPKTVYESHNGQHRLIVDLRGSSTIASPVKTVADVVGSTGRDLIVAIDAGHGGKDPGAIGKSGVREKDITLQMAQEIARQINEIKGLKAHLVRDKDEFIALDGRYMKARQAQADLFVSVHADAAHNARASGASVYVLSLRGASSEAARWLADQENAADLVGGVSLAHEDKNLAAVLLDLSQNATMRASQEAANNVLNAMRELGKTHKPQVEHANFVVLRSPDVPSMLVETGFITNLQDQKRLSDPSFRKQMASAIVKGVREYFALQPPPGTWFAMNQESMRGNRDHIVMRGETLSLIAARHGVPLERIRTANNKQDDHLRVGERLFIPAASAPQ